MKKIFWIIVAVVVIGLISQIGRTGQIGHIRLIERIGLIKSADLKIFSHSDPAFSFEYPKSFDTSSFSDEVGETILFQNADSSGVQIYISAFNEFDTTNSSDTTDSPYASDTTDAPNLTNDSNSSNGSDSSNESNKTYFLTAEKIKQDISDIILENPQEIDVDGGKGVAFTEQDDSLGKTYEVWFVYQSNLYQILASGGQKDFVSQILKTWQWK